MQPDLCAKDFEVSSRGDRDDVGGYSVLELHHKTCGRLVFGFDDDPSEVSLEELLFVAQSHRCDGE